MKRITTLFALLSLSLLVLPGAMLTSDGTTTDIATARLLEAASKAGYVFVAGDDECVVDCDSLTSRCTEGFHTARAEIVVPGENKRGTGDHTLCEEGWCSDHGHDFCDREFATTIQLFDAIEDMDWAGLSQLINRSDVVTYNHERMAIQGLDCNGDHIGLHLQAPPEFVAFLDE